MSNIPSVEPAITVDRLSGRFWVVNVTWNYQESSGPSFFININTLSRDRSNHPLGDLVLICHSAESDCLLDQVDRSQHSGRDHYDVF